jgi:crotonobetainyl-CoA:carnitine CoA-transferase CaiB-like acyl-CoA transferase
MPNGLALDMFPDRPPVKIYGHFAELVGGTSAACAALTALVAQATIGGQFVDVSVQDANVAISCFNVQRVGDGVVESRHGRSFRYGGVLECADGYVQILTLEPRQWTGLVSLMGDPEWTREPGMENEIERGRRGPDINRHLRAWAKTQKVEEMVRGGQALNVPIAKYAGPEEILNSAQLRAHDAFTSVDIDGVGEVPLFTAPFQFTLPPNLTGYPATPGADNSKVLCQWLGHAETELNRWRSEEVL